MTDLPGERTRQDRARDPGSAGRRVRGSDEPGRLDERVIDRAIEPDAAAGTWPGYTDARHCEHREKMMVADSWKRSRTRFVPLTLAMTLVVIVGGSMLAASQRRQSPTASPAAQGEAPSHPWTATETVVPADLVKELTGSVKPTVVCVGFPALYRNGRVPGASLHGPASTADGLANLKAWAAPLPRSSNLVVYLRVLSDRPLPESSSRLQRPARDGVHARARSGAADQLRGRLGRQRLSDRAALRRPRPGFHVEGRVCPHARCAANDFRAPRRGAARMCMIAASCSPRFPGLPPCCRNLCSRVVPVGRCGTR